MKKLFLLILALLTVFALCACEDDGIPEDMQLADGSDEMGYYFYAPEGWVISDVNGITTAYVSRINNTSVSFREYKESEFINEITVCNSIDCKGNELSNAEHFFLYHYFDLTYSALSLQNFTSDGGKAVMFGAEDGRADRAIKYEFSYTYTNVGYNGNDDTKNVGFIQYFIIHDGHYYLLTYTAIKDTAEASDTSNFDNYLDELDMIVDNFRFIDGALGAAQGGDDDTDIERDGDGYRLVSDKSKAGFDFYAPDSFKTDFASGIISVSHADGSNVTLSIATATGNDISTAKYIERRIRELEQIGATEVRMITDTTQEGYENGKPSHLGNVPEGDAQTQNAYAFEFEYTYKFDGEVYHVKQIICAFGNMFSAEGYVFTYTAKEANYLTHIDEVNSIISKVEF